jgi:hypothetical protein
VARQDQLCEDIHVIVAELEGDGDADQPGGEIILYQLDGGPAVQVRLDGETVWLTQAQMGELFQTTPQNITPLEGDLCRGRTGRGGNL